MTYHHGNLKPALLTAAEEILDEEGIAGLTLRAVARRAGVSRQAPYNHFRDLEHLVAAVATKSFDDLAERVENVWREGGSARQLQEIGVHYVGFAVENPGRFRVMFGPQLRRRDDFPDLARAADRAFDALSRPPADLWPAPREHREEVEPVPISPHDPRTALWSVVHGLAHLLIDGQLTAGPADTEAAAAYARAATEAVWFGLAKG